MFHFFPSPPVAFVGRVRRPSHGSSIDRSVSRRSKPDDPRRSIRRITTRRFGRDTPKTSHPIGRARVDIASTFSPGRPMDARARIHPSIVARRSSAVSSLRGVKPPFVERVASRERASVRLDRSVGFARMDGWMDGSFFSEDGSRVRRVMDFGLDFSSQTSHWLVFFFKTARLTTMPLLLSR